MPAVNTAHILEESLGTYFMAQSYSEVNPRSWIQWDYCQASVYRIAATDSLILSS